jgi:hypothetical protein
MRFATKVVLGAVFISLLESITIPQASVAATSYVNSGTYYAYETFASSATWTRPYGVTSVDYLVVAGGGRGGGSQASTHFAGGGGGGGGVRTGSLTVGQSSYTVTVGTGQTAGCSQGRGGNSSLAGSDITTVSATGGGSGSCNVNTGDGGGGIDGYSGGSGGGAGAQVNAKTYGSGNAGNYTPVEGYAGGSSYAHTTDATYQAGGGGGGAGAVGNNATAACAGSGGSGVSSSITGTSVNYGGGGGGGTRYNSCGGSGGAGGGGAGGLNGAQGAAGTNGLGGGGGGTSLVNGNAGGDGVVIVRFLLTAPATPTLPAGSDTGRSNSDRVTNATSFSLTGSAVGGSSVQIYDGATAVGSPCTANMTTGAYSCALTSQSAGTHTYSAKASFGGGTENPSASSITVVIDVTGPTITGTSVVSVAENSSSSQTLRTNETATINFNGTYDRAQFTLDTTTGLLSFGAHDYENPLDYDLNNQYYVSISATDVAGNPSLTYNFFYTVTNVAEAATLSSISLSANPSKGIAVTLTFTSDVSGKVTFYANGKRIAGCISKSTTGSSPSYSGSCSWKPTTTASTNLYAAISSPTSAFLTTNTSVLTLQPTKRSTTR